MIDAVVLARSWRNGIALGGLALVNAALFIAYLATPPFGPGYVAFEAGALSLSLVVATRAFRSGRVWVEGESLFMTRLFRPRVEVHRGHISSVELKISAFGLRTGLGRSIDLRLRDGTVVNLGEMQVPGANGNSQNAEGLLEKIQQWLTSGNPDDAARDVRSPSDPAR